jgi:cyclophilin family peptidyl-prolyl cis-trans isomerase/protein-disulfide isomerase
MKKIIFPLLLTAALLLSACATSTAEPTTEPTTAPTAEPQPTGGEEAAPAAASASEENPCIPFSLMEQTLTSPYPGLPELTEDDWVLGPRNAPVSFMVYSEPQCPYCAQIDPLLDAFQALYPEDVNVVFRFRPFNESFHDKSILASQAMEAAGLQGKFDEFRKWIFERQSKNPNNPNVANLADSEFWVPVAPDQLDEWLAARVSELGIDPDQLIEDMFSDAVVQKIAAAKDSADQLAINGTPTLFLNGYQWPENSRGVDIFSIYTELLLNQRNEFQTCPQMVIDTAKSYSATIETSKGNIQVELYDDSAPYAVNSFVFLANEGYYNNLPFITTAEFALSGDPSDTGYGGPGYAFKDEINADYDFTEAGMLSTFGLGPNLNGSAFFINKTALEGQEGRTIFGRVTEGLEVLDTLTLRDNIFAPVEDTIIKITITES